MNPNHDEELVIAVRIASAKWREASSSDTQEDVAQELRMDLLVKPSTVHLLSGVARHERIAILTRMAKSIFSLVIRGERLANNEVLASTEMVKAVLKGDHTMPLLVELVNAGMAKLSEQDNGYAEALRNRYEFGIVPQTEVEQNRQKFAHIKLTDAVNDAYRALFSPPEKYYDCSDKPFPVLMDGPGSKHAVEASSRKASGGHSDPTADAAIALLEADPEERALLLEETPLAKILKGKG